MGHRKQKIFFVIPSLAGAGAERVLIYLLQYINRDLFCPILVVFDETNTSSNQIPEDVIIFNLNKKSPLDFFRLVKQLSRIIRKEQPALIVSFLTYTNYLILLARSCSQFNVPVILSEHGNLSKSLENQRFKYTKRGIIRFFYPKAEKIIAVSQGVKEDIVNKYFLPADRISVIYNSVDFELVKKNKHERVGHSWFRENIPVIIACGRLIPSKGFTDLITAFSLVCSQSPARLVFIGAGEERDKLEKLTKKLGLNKKVLFLGYQEDPFKFMARATIFALSSYWEGFGNVIIEAMACGTPVISTRCPSGPDEIITDGLNGLLVPVGDVDALAGAILRLLKDEPLRKRLAEEGKKRAGDFRVEKMVAEYERVFKKVASKRG